MSLLIATIGAQLLSLTPTTNVYDSDARASSQALMMVALGLYLLCVLLVALSNPASSGHAKEGEAMGFGGFQKVEGGDRALEPDERDPSEILPLPGSTNDPSVPKIQLGDKIRLEHLGPLIINPDGTTRRIANWDAMTPAEQERTMRRIGKRNEARLEVLQRSVQMEGDEATEPQEVEMSERPSNEPFVTKSCRINDHA